MFIKKSNLAAAIVSILFFCISVVLLEHYYLGDQRFYIKFYKIINGVPLSNIPPIALSTLNSYEPISWLLLWLGFAQASSAAMRRIQ